MGPVYRVPARLQIALLALALFLLNFYICRELFQAEYLNFMSSVAGEFIGMSRYEITHWKDLTWFPLWNGGTPFPTTYPPLLPLAVAFSAWLSGASVAHAYHWITALTYCLGPVALYALTLRLSGSRWAGFVAGLLYTCVSTSFWILPAIGRDLGNPFFSRRFQALVFYGEGPHVSSMTLLTVAMLLLDIAMKRRQAHWTMLAAAAFAATAVTNWLGAFATVLFVGPYVLAHLFDAKPSDIRPGYSDPGWSGRDLGRLALLGVASYCLAMPLMPPSTIAVLQLNARNTGGNFAGAYQHALPQWLAVLAALVAIKIAVRRWPRHVQFALLLTLLLTLAVTADQLWNIPLVPLAFRYQLEMEMALAMLTALAAHAVFRNRAHHKHRQWMAAVAIGVLVLALIQPIRLQRHRDRTVLQPIDVTKTIEWREAQWFNQNWNGERVYVPGSVGFWLTAFSDTPQLLGFEQATTNQMNRIAEYTINAGDVTGAHETDSAVLWMKALGVHAVAVSGPSSQEAYKPFAKPMKFEGVLPPLWRDGDDVIYQVGDHAGLARVVPRVALVSRAPIHGLDLDPLRPYVTALDDPRMPTAEFHWTTAHSATIAATLDPGQVLSLQIAWAGSWNATVNGRPTPIQRDAIGQMYIDPNVSGPCAVAMVYDGGAEMRIAHVLSALTALLLVAAWVVSAWGALLKRE